MGWIITLGILTLLAILPLGVSAKYDSDGPLVRLIIGPVRITLFPRPKKEKKKKEKKKPEGEPAPEPEKKAKPAREKPEKTAETGKEPEEEKKSSGGPITDFLPLVGTVFDFLGNFRRKLRVNRLELKLILAGDDPCDLATNYGRAWAALGNLWPRLERWFVIRKRDVEVECDFTASQTLIVARLDLTITLGRVLAAVFTFAFHALVEFLKIMKKRKGGASNEPKSSQYDAGDHC